MTNTERTAGQAFTAEIRHMFSIGPRTRWYRTNRYSEALTQDAIVERVSTSVAYRGYDDERRTAIFVKAYAALCGYDKHVNGYRIDPTLRMRITTRTPWEWTAYLGQMVDSGATCNGEFEQWFRDQAQAAA
jgi:hypothetical protein